MTIDGIQLSYSLAELRRFAFQYVDIKGQLARDLLTTYQGVGFESGPLSWMESIKVEVEGTQRKGFINGQHVGFEESNPSDVERFERDTRVFFRRVERDLEVSEYDRVGIRFVMDIAAQDVDLAARNLLGINVKLEWPISEFVVRFDTTIDGWQVAIRVSPVIDQAPEGQFYAGRIQFDVDQHREKIASPEAQRLRIVEAYARAETVVANLVGQ